jgi:CSLREA domain-containing protein
MRTIRAGAGVFLVVWWAAASSASAAVIIPTTTSDDISNNGNCTLREAIQAANTGAAVDHCPAGHGHDVIKLGHGTYVLSVSGARENSNQSGDLDVTAPVTIEGPTSGKPPTIDAKSTDRAIDIQPGAGTTIERLTITDGVAPQGPLFGGAGESGGGIRAQSALKLLKVNVTKSSAGGGTTSHVAPGVKGGNAGDGGGVWTDAALTITGGSFSNDQAGSGGSGSNGADTSASGADGHPGGAGAPGGSGGAVAVTGGSPLTIMGTRFSHDAAGDGGAGGDGGGSTLEGAGGDGGDGGVGGGGGAIFVDGIAKLSHVNISSTNAGGGGIGGLGGGAGSSSSQQKHNGDSGNSGDGGRGGAIAAGGNQLTVTAARISQTTAGAGAVQNFIGFGGAPQTGGGHPGAGGAGGAVSGLGHVVVGHTVIELAHGGVGGPGSPHGYPVVTPGGAGGDGGGIDGEDVTVIDSTIAASSGGQGGTGGVDCCDLPGGPGGHGGGGGAVHATHSLTMNGDTLEHDSAGAGGAGASESDHTSPKFAVAAGPGGPGGDGGAVLADASAMLANTTVFADRAGQGGAGGDNTETAHPANGGAGGGGGGGGAVHVTGASASLVHVTMMGGAAGQGGAGGTSSAATAGGPGPAGTAGGVAGPATLIASVVANSGPGQCSGTTDGGHNISFPDPSCGGKHIAPKLAGLANNGGPTQTLLPQPGSPVLDKVPTGGPGCSGSAIDQRGVPRPQGPACDIGAVEAANPALRAAPNPLAFGSVATGKTATAAVTIRNTFDPLRVTIALQGTQANAFAITANGCRGRLLAPHASCRVSLRFTASGTPGPRAAILHVTHTTPGPQLNVRLTASVRAK